MMNRFEGDGRMRLTALPEYTLPGTRPIAVRQSSARLICKRFEQKGHSNHTGLGQTVWVVLEYCALKGIPVDTSMSKPGEWYYVKRKDQS